MDGLSNGDNMKIDEKLKGDYEGKIRCDLCKRVLKEGEPVDTIQTGMYIEDAGETTQVQYGDDQVETVICKKCSPKVKVVVV